MYPHPYTELLDFLLFQIIKQTLIFDKLSKYEMQFSNDDDVIF